MTASRRKECTSIGDNSYPGSAPARVVPFFPINWGDISPDTLYDLEKDRQQLAPIREESLLEEYKEKLVEAMEQEKFPQDAFMRLGLISGID